MKSALVLLECLQSQFHDPVLTSLCSWWELEGACGVEAGGEFPSESWGGGGGTAGHLKCVDCISIIATASVLCENKYWQKVGEQPPPLPPGVFERHT